MKNLRTNMSEEELFDMFFNLTIQCKNCKLFHMNHDVIPECKGCETDLWIKQLSDHFGINLSVSYKVESGDPLHAVSSAQRPH